MKKSVKKSKSKDIKSQLKKCKKMLSEKIAINMREFKQGRYKSPKQAIAVSYAQLCKKSPICNRVFSNRKSPTKTPKPKKKSVKVKKYRMDY